MNLSNWKSCWPQAIVKARRSISPAGLASLLHVVASPAVAAAVAAAAVVVVVAVAVAVAAAADSPRSPSGSSTKNRQSPSRHRASPDFLLRSRRDQDIGVFLT